MWTDETEKGCCQICQWQMWLLGQNCHSVVFWAAQEQWIYGKLRSVGGKTDKTDREIQRASLCYDWVTGQGGVWYGCIFKWFKRRVVLSVLCAHVKADESCQTGWFHFAPQWDCVCLCCGRIEKSNFCLPLKTTLILRICTPFNCSQFCESHVSIMISINRLTTLSPSMRDIKREKINMEEGKSMRWLRKLGWKRTEIALGAVWLRL